MKTDNDVFVDQTATDEYAVFQFKNQGPDSITKPTATCKVKSDLAPSSSTVYLQVYNVNTTVWETIDSDSVTGADVEFTLTAILETNLTDYHDVDFWYSFRVYQLAI